MKKLITTFFIGIIVWSFSVIKAVENTIKNHYIKAQSNQYYTKPETIITIFIHGMLNISSHVNCTNLYLFKKDAILNTIYAHTIQNMRNDEFFYIHDGLGPLGLTKIDLANLDSGNTVNNLAYIYDAVCRLSDKKHCNRIYYTFGWSGLFSIRQRYLEAENLLLGIHTLVEQYKRLGIHPNIHLVGYSHGGNVALNIAAIHKNKYPSMPISIDTLILIGTPVQIETDTLVESPLFKKIYHFYSRLDRIQPLDLFSAHSFFSARTFEHRSTFTVPAKVTQIQVKCTRAKKGIPAHILSNPDFPHTETIHKSGQRRILRDTSPGHVELWFFEWTMGSYRKHFPLAPLPVLSFVPYMITAVDSIKESCMPVQPLIFDMRPECGISLIRQHKNPSLCESVPFLEQEFLDALHAIAYRAKADEYTKENYQAHLDTAFDKACIIYNNENNNTLKKKVSVHKKCRRRKVRRPRMSNHCTIV